MAQVKFKNQWFGPDGVRYREGVQEVPDTLLDVLPSSAEVMEAPKPAAKVEAKAEAKTEK